MALIVLFTVLLAAAELIGDAAAATYVVGGSLGWGVPSGGPTTYTAWASQHVFRVGDVLVFNFPTGIHDVAHVTKAAYDGCSSTNPIELATLGPANFTLDSTGEHYYICTFGQHCPLGQKLAVNVTGAAISPAPAPTPSPGPTITPTPMPTTSPSPGPVPLSSPTTAPMPTPSMGPTPYPAPSGGVALPPTPASELAPGSAVTPSSSLPTGDLSQPPPPSSASVASVSALFVLFASIGYGFLI